MAHGRCPKRNPVACVISKCFKTHVNCNLLLKSRSDVKRALASTSHGFLLDFKKQHVLPVRQSVSTSRNNYLLRNSFITLTSNATGMNKRPQTNHIASNTKILYGFMLSFVYIQLLYDRDLCLEFIFSKVI